MMSLLFHQQVAFAFTFTLLLAYCYLQFDFHSLRVEVEMTQPRGSEEGRKMRWTDEGYFTSYNCNTYINIEVQVQVMRTKDSSSLSLSHSLGTFTWFQFYCVLINLTWIHPPRVHPTTNHQVRPRSVKPMIRIQTHKLKLKHIQTDRHEWHMTSANMWLRGQVPFRWPFTSISPKGELFLFTGRPVIHGEIAHRRHHLPPRRRFCSCCWSCGLSGRYWWCWWPRRPRPRRRRPQNLTRVWRGERNKKHFPSFLFHTSLNLSSLPLHKHTQTVRQDTFFVFSFCLTFSSERAWSV